MRDNLRTLLLLAILAMAVLAGSVLPDMTIMWIIAALAICQSMWWFALFAGEEGIWTERIRPLMKWTMKQIRRMKRKSG